MVPLRNSPPFLRLLDGQRPVEQTPRITFSSAVSMPGSPGLESVTFGISNGRLLRRRLLRGKQASKQLRKLVGSVQPPRRTVVTFLTRHFRTFQVTRNRRVLRQAWSQWLQFVEKRRCYFDSFSDDSFDSEYEVFTEWPSLLARVPSSDFLPTCDAQRPWSGCAITVDEADTDGTWELPSLTSDCAGELEMIRYAIWLSTMAFEEDAAAAVSWEHEVSLLGRLERARFASQMASLKHHWETSRGHLRRNGRRRPTR
jgi:hypothetical protein